VSTRSDLAQLEPPTLDAGTDIGLELYWDRPRDEWPVDPGGGYAMGVEALDRKVCWRRPTGTECV